MANKVFKIMLKAYRRYMKKSGRATSFKYRQRFGQMKYPYRYQKEYMAILRAYRLRLETGQKELINKEQWDYWLTHQDTIEEPPVRIIGTLQEFYAKELKQLYPLLEEHAEKQYIFFTQQWQGVMEKIVGYKWSSEDAWWESAKTSWVDENIGLIKGMDDDNLNKISQTVYRNTRQGVRWEDTSKELQHINGVSKSRADLIARDQTAKLNSTLTQHRQQDLGIDKYIWSTAADERVRGTPGGKYPTYIPSHYMMEGLTCRWDDSSVYSEDGGKTWLPKTSNMVQLHPGIAIQCRCMAIADFTDILAEIDVELDNE